MTNTVDSIRARQHEISERLGAIQDEMGTDGVDAKRLKEFTTEVNELKEEYSGLDEQKSALEAIANVRANEEVLSRPVEKRVENGGDTSWRVDNSGHRDTDTPDDYAPVSEQTRTRRSELWSRFNAGDKLTDEEAATMRQRFPEDRAYIRWLREGNAVPQEVRAALGATAAITLADVVVPEMVMNELVLRMKWYGPMMDACRVLRTSDGQKLEFPFMNATAKTAAIKAQTDDVATTEQKVVGVPFEAHTGRADALLFSREVLQDSAVSPETIVMETYSQAYGRLINNKATVGTGTDEPRGITVAVANNDAVGHGPTNAFTTATSAQLKIADLLKAKSSVDIAYRGVPSFGVMINDETAQALRAESGTNTDYLWQPDLREGVPNRFNGHNVWVNNDLANVAGSSKSAVFGSFDKYLIRIVNDLTIRRSEERYAERNAVAFFSDIRWDSNYLDPAAFSIVTTKA